MDYMARLNFKEGYPVTYDREKAEKVKLEMRELNLAKSLKDEGIPIDKIIKLTNLNKNQIMML